MLDYVNVEGPCWSDEPCMGFGVEVYIDLPYLCQTDKLVELEE